MALFERFFGKTPEEHLGELKGTVKADKEETVLGDNSSPEMASNEEVVRAWGSQPDANDPASRAADKAVLKRIEENEQVKKTEMEEK